MAQHGPRPAEHDERMSDTEALLWHVDHDPWLTATIGAVAVTDVPADPVLLRRRMAAAAAAVPRLRSRAVARHGRLAPPVWEPDPEFDLDQHLRRIALPAPADLATLLDLAARLLADPFDRTRPLWQFVLVEGLTGGRGALVCKVHHSLTDGTGVLRLAESCLDRVRHPVPEPVPEPLVARPVAGPVGKRHHPPCRAAMSVALGTARRLAGDALVALADPVGLAEAAAATVETLRAGLEPLGPGGSGHRSPLWSQRSRHRTLRVLDVGLGPLMAAADTFGVKLNDVFVAGVAAAAGDYHRRSGSALGNVTVTFVRSTRRGSEPAGNAFSTIRAVLPTGSRSPGEASTAVRDQVVATHEALARARAADGDGDGLLDRLAGPACLLPAGLLSRLARAEAATIDVATSNIRGPATPAYVAGAEILAIHPIGPVVGTACNLTLLTYRGTAQLGLHLDPVAVAEPDLLVECLGDAYRAIGEAATARRQRR